jgi:ribose 5-phosphate isomerase B
MIAIASDHAGFNFKETAKEYFYTNNILYKDFGTNSVNSVDYPMFAKLVCDSILKKESEKGILICGTGIGMCIAANKFKGIYAALCIDEFTAKRARSHNDANVLCIGELITDKSKFLDIINNFLITTFEGNRHLVRINQIKNLEE